MTLSFAVPSSRSFRRAATTAMAALVACAALALPAAAQGSPGPELATAARQTFPDVPGVDLGSLGYRGSPIDGSVIERLSAPLPSDPRDRLAEIGMRLDGVPDVVADLRLARAALADAVERFDDRAGQLEQAHAVAQGRRDEAIRRVASAERRIVERVGALETKRADMAEVAVAAYVRPPDADVLAAVLGGVATTSSDLAADALFDAKAEHDGVVRDGLEVAAAVAGERLQQVTTAAHAADARLAEVVDQLHTIQVRLAAHEEALALVQSAGDALEASIPVLQQDRDATIERAWGALDQLPGVSVVDVPLLVVEGISVHAAIAPRLEALLDAADRDGVELDGWGYRTVERQIMLRRAHCGPTPEDIYLKPAGACSPPTAQPGSSLHERGLAIDFHVGGQSISTRESPAYQWLAANAAIYGFHNLPSEPWHWSVNGQ